MIDLTPRQIKILRAIVEEYINTGTSVGSDTLDKKYSIGVSPATIRNEMVYLTKQGYLYKPHASAGRMPTHLALKLYVNELMKEKELSVADEVSAKEKIWKSRNQIDELIQVTTKVLAEKSKALGIALTQDGHIYHSGYANLVSMPEFENIDLIRQVFTLIEQANLLEQIFSYGANDNKLQVVYGQELGNQTLEPLGIIYFSAHPAGSECKLGVIGSLRFDYPYLMPMMRFFKDLIEDMAA